MAADRMEALDSGIAHEASVLVTIGGRWVGDHELVQKAMTGRGMPHNFRTVTMRPG